MGLLSWIWPSDADRIETAKGHIASERWADAREALWGIELDEATSLRIAAETELCKMNLEHAVTWADAGDEYRVRMHMELADEMHHGGLEQQFRETRRQLREIRAIHRSEQQLAQEEKEARLLSVNPLGMGGGDSLLAPTPTDGHLDPDADEKAARIALIVENYPEPLRAAVEPLGFTFGRALLDLDDGRPDLALPTLLSLPDDVAMVRWERARAAYAMGDPKAAAKELVAFGQVAGTHHPVGQWHTGVLLAQYTAEAGDPPAALRVLRALRADDPKLGGALFAQLLFRTGALAEAENVCRELIQSAPRADFLYALLADIRLAGGHREAAVSALEAAMDQVCCTPGKCGNKPPNQGILRRLATLYLEDGTEPERGLDLAQQAADLQQGPLGWEDGYLAALVAREAKLPEATELANQMWSATPSNHPGRARLEAFLGSSGQATPPAP